MIEDGIYVSFESKDSNKTGTPKSIVIISGGDIKITVNPKGAKQVNDMLESIKSLLSKDDADSKEVAEARLLSYWDSNMYEPNPSSFYELKDSDGEKFIEMSKSWDKK